MNPPPHVHPPQYCYGGRVGDYKMREWRPEFLSLLCLFAAMRFAELP
jgi:hypothetical protein